GRAFQYFGQGVRRFEGGNDSLRLRQLLRRRQSFFVAYLSVFDAPLVVKCGVFRPDGGVIQSCRYRVRVRYQSILILKNVGIGPMQHAWTTPGKPRGMITQAQAAS